MPGDAIQETQNFEERMMSKIKESIGDMITDDELKKIVERGIEKAFFEPKMRKDQYGNREITDEPLAIRAVREFARKKADETVEKWIKENPQKIGEILDSVLRDGIVKIVTQTIDQMFYMPLQTLKNEFQNRFRL